MFGIARGDRARIDGELYQFTHQTAGKAYCFREIDNGNVAQLNEAQMLEKFRTGQLELRVAVQDGSPPAANLTEQDFTCATEEHKKIAEDRRTYVQAILQAGKPRPMAKAWPSIIANVASLLGHARTVRWTTVRRWVRTYEANAGNLSSLLPRFAKRGRGPKNRPPSEEAFLNEIIEDYLVNRRPSTRWLVDEVHRKYREAKTTRVEAAEWKVPSRSTVQRRLKRLDPYEVTRLRYGKRIADEQFRAIGPGRKATYRLEVVEIDHTVGNLMVVDEINKVCLGRPYITVAIDRYTRMIVGLYIGFEPPSVYCVMQCLRDMFLPKDYLQKDYPELQLEWRAFGPPVTVVVDNAVEFLSDSFREVAARLNFDIYQQPVYQPQFKGTVERFMRTIEQGLMTGLPGRTFSNIQEKADYNPEKAACIELSEFRRLFYHWMLANYCYRTHDGILDIPARRWDEEVKRDPIRPSYNANDLDVLLGILKTRPITRQGLRFANLRYQSQQLNALFRNAKNDEERTVTFRVNPGDLGWISVFGPSMRHPLRVPCTEPQYANSLSLHQHRLIRAFQIKRNKDFENDITIIEARDQFFALAAELMQRAKTSDRRRHARTTGGNLVNQRAKTVQRPPREADLNYVRALMATPESDPLLRDLLEEDTRGNGNDDAVADAPVPPTLTSTSSEAPARPSRAMPMRPLSGQPYRPNDDDDAIHPLPEMPC